MRIFLTCLFAFSLCAETLLVEGKPDLPKLKTKDIPEFRSLAKALSASVVNINAETAAEEPEAGTAPEKLPSLPFFQNKPGTSLGSGFIVSTDGFVVTNHHVVDKAKKIVVKLLDDKKEYIAKLIGSDEKTDLALIKIEGSNFVPMYMGDSEKVEVGEWVVAIGNQFQLGQTVTAGIVSAIGRKMPTKISGPYDEFIQTDASINPGSSGGPLINTEGQVVGINTAIFSPGRAQFGGSGFNIGIGFAIPINLAKTVLDDLKVKGKVTRGFLGVLIQPIDADIASILKLAEPTGALVADVTPESPAALAGFKSEDVIIKFDGKTVAEHSDLPLIVAQTPVGKEVDVEIFRDNQPKILKVKIAEMQSLTPTIQPDEEVTEPNKLGMYLKDLNEDVVKSLKLPSKDGVIVVGVDVESSADQAGITRGDVILAFNRKNIKNVEDFEATLAALAPGQASLLKIRKKDGTRFVVIKSQDIQ